jgi:hypothetical protein
VDEQPTPFCAIIVPVTVLRVTGNTPKNGMVKLRVLVAIEDEYRSFWEAVAETIQMLRSHIEVTIAEPGTLETEVASFDPHLVFCSRPNMVSSNRRPAWVEVPPLPVDRRRSVSADVVRSRSTQP